jgi:hypothetical protein
LELLADAGAGTHIGLQDLQDRRHEYIRVVGRGSEHAAAVESALLALAA